MTELYLSHPAAAPDTDLFDGRWTATIVSASPLLARQDGGSTSLVVLNGMPDRQHVAGDRVKLQRFGSDLVIMAALTPRPQFGTVVSVNAGARTAVISTASAQWSVQWSVQYLGTAPTVADRVAMFWGPEGGVILGSAGATVTPPASTDPGSAAPPPATGGTLTVSAVQGGSFRSSARRPDVGTKLYQGHWIPPASSADNSGIFCYGDVFGGLAGKTITSAKLTVTRGPKGAGADGAVPLSFVSHAAMTLPATPPAYSGLVTSLSLAPNQSGQVDVTSIAAGLANGTVRGFGISYAGITNYCALLGPDELPGTGSLSIVYV